MPPSSAAKNASLSASGARVRGATRASLYGQVASQTISILGLAALLRLLKPADYGLVGMITPLIMFLRIFVTLGLNVAAVQQQEISSRQRSSLFWMQILFGTIVTAVVAALAPSVAWFYDAPERGRELVQLTYALAATSLVAALSSQPEALLQRRLAFGRLAWSRCVAQGMAALVAIVTACLGGGVWALVVQQYVELILLAVGSFAASGFRPEFACERAKIGAMFRFGGAFAAATAILYVSDHLDKIVVGKLIGPYAAGLYSQAFNLMIKPVYLVTTPLTAIAVAAVARTASVTERGTVVADFYRQLVIVLLPVCGGLAVTGSDVMLVLGGGRWAAAGPVLTALSAGLFAQSVLILNGWVLAAIGRANELLIGSLACLLLITQGCLCGWWIGNHLGEPTHGVAWGRSLTVTLALLLPHTWLTLRAARVSYMPLLRQLARPAVATVVMTVAVVALHNTLSVAVTSPAIRLAVEAPTGFCIYVLLARDELRWLREASGLRK